MIAFAVVDGRGRLDLRSAQWRESGWEDWHALVLTSRAAPQLHLTTLRDRGIPYHVTGDERVDLPVALQLLAGELGVHTAV